MLNVETITPVAETISAQPAVSAGSVASTSRRIERIAVVGLVILYLASAYGFAVVTPYGESPDEYSHLLYIEHIVRYNTFPAIQKNSL